jgi:hypothetical protein
MNHWRQPIIDTLDFCALRLPSSIHPTHIQRMILIKGWLGTDTSGAPPQPTGAVEQVLNWTEQGATFTAQTAHGQVIVNDVRTPRSPYLIGRAAEHYRARILHSTGAVLESQEQFSRFEGAEAWVHTILAQLDNPQLEEANLESIRFTLAICKQVLPDDAHPAHLANLQILEEILVETLL